MGLNFKLYSRQAVSVAGKTFVVSIEEAGGLYRAQTQVKWKNPAMQGFPLATNAFKDAQSAVKQITVELERLLKGGEIQGRSY
ncbi:MAG: hypothetical protein QXR53_02015 [Candidatus Norongarragalinales archaeon]